jgi:hypothetical protein
MFAVVDHDYPDSPRLYSHKTLDDAIAEFSRYHAAHVESMTGYVIVRYHMQAGIAYNLDPDGASWLVQLGMMSKSLCDRVRNQADTQVPEEPKPWDLQTRLVAVDFERPTSTVGQLVEALKAIDPSTPLLGYLDTADAGSHNGDDDTVFIGYVNIDGLRYNPEEGLAATLELRDDFDTRQW